MVRLDSLSKLVQGSSTEDIYDPDFYKMTAKTLIYISDNAIQYLKECYYINNPVNDNVRKFIDKDGVVISSGEFYKFLGLPEDPRKEIGMARKIYLATEYLKETDRERKIHLQATAVAIGLMDRDGNFKDRDVYLAARAEWLASLVKSGRPEDKAKFDAYVKSVQSRVNTVGEGREKENLKAELTQIFGVGENLVNLL